jgi:hypothetical protein
MRASKFSSGMRRKNDLNPGFFDRDFFPCDNAPQFGLTASEWKRYGDRKWAQPQIAHVSGR